MKPFSFPSGSPSNFRLRRIPSLWCRQTGGGKPGPGRRGPPGSLWGRPQCRDVSSPGRRASENRSRGSRANTPRSQGGPGRGPPGVWGRGRGPPLEAPRGSAQSGVAALGDGAGPGGRAAGAARRDHFRPGQDGGGAAAGAGAGGAVAAVRAAALGALRRGARRAQPGRSSQGGWLPGRRRAPRRDSVSVREERGGGGGGSDTPGPGRAGPGGPAGAPLQPRRPTRSRRPLWGAARGRPESVLRARAPGPGLGPRRGEVVRSALSPLASRAPRGKYAGGLPGGGAGRAAATPAGSGPGRARCHRSQGRSISKRSSSSFCVFQPNVSLTLAFWICSVFRVFVFPKSTKCSLSSTFSRDNPSQIRCFCV